VPVVDLDVWVALATDTALDLYLRWVLWPCQMSLTFKSNSSVPYAGRKDLSVPRMGRKGRILSVVVVLLLSIFFPQRINRQQQIPPPIVSFRPTGGTEAAGQVARLPADLQLGHERTLAGYVEDPRARDGIGWASRRISQPFAAPNEDWSSLLGFEGASASFALLAGSFSFRRFVLRRPPRRFRWCSSGGMRQLKSVIEV